MATQSATHFVGLLAFALLIATGAEARVLRQFIDSWTGAGVDKSTMVLATTEGGHEQGAEADAQSHSLGYAHLDPTNAAIAAQLYPGAAVRASTPNTNENLGPAMQVSAAVFRTVALSVTDQGAVSSAAADAMPLAYPKGTPGAAQGTTLKTFEPFTVKGIGAKQDVMGFSAGFALLPSNALGISDVGDGPNAVSMAGEAVATSFSSKMDITNRDQKLAGVLNRPAGSKR